MRKAPAPAVIERREIMPSEPPTSMRRKREADVPTERRMTVAVPLFECVPVVALELQEMKNVPLGTRAAFLVSRIDGVSTVGTLFDVCGMSEEESLDILNDLLELGIVVLR